MGGGGEREGGREEGRDKEHRMSDVAKQGRNRSRNKERGKMSNNRLKYELQFYQRRLFRSQADIQECSSIQMSH